MEKYTDTCICIYYWVRLKERFLVQSCTILVCISKQTKPHLKYQIPYNIVMYFTYPEIEWSLLQTILLVVRVYKACCLRVIMYIVSGWPQRRKQRLRRCSSRRERRAQLIEWVARARQEGRGLPHCSSSLRRIPSVDTRASSSSGHILFLLCFYFE